jgi:hypothetical protein
LPPRANNAAVAAGCALIGVGFALLPLYFSRTSPQNLTLKPDALGGHQVMRGPYVNTGSRDAGWDPSWQRDSRTGAMVYVGKAANAITPEDVQRFRSEKQAGPATTP